MYENEVFFDLYSAGAFHHEGFVCLGGPGRAVFDAQTKQFKRMEPLGGAQPASLPSSATGGNVAMSVQDDVQLAQPRSNTPLQGVRQEQW